MSLPVSLLFSVLFLAVAIFAWSAIYRLYFHPLASVPGDKLAGLTRWYEFFWDGLMGGQYMFKIRDMHERYGPIVRINPGEVHINDHLYWEVLFSNTLKLDKDPTYYGLDAGNCTAFSTVAHDVHRRRRGAFSKFFSAGNVAKLEPQVQQKLNQLLGRIEELGKAGQVVDLSNAFRSLSMDVISIFTEPQPRDNLSAPDFSKPLHDCLRVLSGTFIWQRMVPALQTLDAIPRFVWTFINPSVNVLYDKRDSLKTQARAVIASGGKPETDRPPTVFEAIYNSSLLGVEDKTPERLAWEAETILGAGTETTGMTLCTLVYHLQTNPKILERLKEELMSCSSLPREAMVDFRTLNGLPYLQAVIWESLRVGCPVSGRLVRTNSRHPMTYTTPGPDAKTYVFPPGTVLSMTMRDLHENRSVFPKPKDFQPERWLDSSDPTSTSTAEQRKLMDRYFVPFSKGTRSCVGMELAKQELTLTVGNLFRRFDLELFETTRRDIEAARDYFSPFGPSDSEGVRVKVKL
ncbi:uncharacterized protein K452DRAFT_246052 [Aplosporella prunicola CBS 121167]|uniref:Cytochrome P450 n=1 Tax=Aplosporella prunicola CBS 121167 TaxID=1176127 RepID=A0A6A6BIK0_9PEZI|nr:uncharacterized protein K452DRAFT_246052 [Aplosporella prunicola CBS 121167]KAF2143970.1 hypothetical protein K452DRAFT_246052 [Aplosporella prunicola CBS 121167]